MNYQIIVGETRTFQKLVTSADLASFNGQLVHAVCSTFALAQAVEWASRLFVLEIKAADEEGIGTALNIQHHHPAFPGEIMDITATLHEVVGNEVTCLVVAKVGDRLIATGETQQKILKKEKLAKFLNPNWF